MDGVELQMHSTKFPIEQNGSRDRLMMPSASASVDGLDNASMEDPYSIYRGPIRGSNHWHASRHSGSIENTHYGGASHSTDMTSASIGGTSSTRGVASQPPGVASPSRGVASQRMGVASSPRGVTSHTVGGASHSMVPPVDHSPFVNGSFAPTNVDAGSSEHMHSTSRRMFDRDGWDQCSHSLQNQQHQHNQQQQQLYTSDRQHALQFQQQQIFQDIPQQQTHHQANLSNSLANSSQLSSNTTNGKPLNSDHRNGVNDETHDKARNGTLSKKYFHIKDMISNRFGKNSASETNKMNDQQNNGNLSVVNNNSRQNSVNSSFRKAIQSSSSKPNSNDEQGQSAVGSNFMASNSNHYSSDVATARTSTSANHNGAPPLPQHPPPIEARVNYSTSDSQSRTHHVRPPLYSAPPSAYGSVAQARYGTNAVPAHTPISYAPISSRIQENIYGTTTSTSASPWPSAANSPSRAATLSSVAETSILAHTMATTSTEPVYVTRNSVTQSAAAAAAAAAVVSNSPFLQRSDRGKLGSSATGTPTKGAGQLAHPLHGNLETPFNLNSSLESAGAGSSQRSRPVHVASQSSGNDSEWIDIAEPETRHMYPPGRDHMGVSQSTTFGVDITNKSLTRGENSTPPLPALSLNNSPGSSAPVTPKLISKFQPNCRARDLSQPDLLGNMSPKAVQPHGSTMTEVGGAPGVANWSQQQQQETRPARSAAKMITPDGHMQIASEKRRHGHRRLASVSSTGAVDGMTTCDAASMTTALQDVESILDQTTDLSSDEEGEEDGPTNGTAGSLAIRKQLESLETMYSEVLRLLGGQRRSQQARLAAASRLHPISASSGAAAAPPPSMRHRMYGSLSSLPSSVTGGGASVGARYHTRDRRRDEKRKSKEMKGINKRFQRLESHVVTLARSVAHLSSEIRTQHALFQELESLRAEMNELRAGPVRQVVTSAAVAGSTPGRHNQLSDWDSFRDAVPSLTHPGRVRKLTKFFGDEPPLIRLFLKKLGYEKFAVLFEREKIGMIELPYMTDDRLQKLGIPVGPRLRILQEAQMSLRKDSYNVYIL